MTYITSPKTLAWPFDGDTYRYTTNVESVGSPIETAAGSWGHTIVEIDESYLDVMHQRAEILRREPERCRALPHMRPAIWDALVFVLQSMSDLSPETMSLTEADGEYTWKNNLLGLCQTFRFGDDGSLPVPPLEFLMSQVEEDVFLLSNRDGQLFIDATAATFAGSWSTTFALGMSFTEIHGPVPRIHGNGMVDRTQRFLLGMDSGEVVRRLNWTIHDGDELDASLEISHARDPLRQALVESMGLYGELRLRVEIQHLIRLPMTDAILFLIKTHLTPLQEIVTIPEWRRQVASVFSELPDDMADYKGFLRYRPGLLAWLGE